MSVFLYASFPNSRIKPRPSTSQAITYQVAVNLVGGALSNLALANPNRTYILLQNFSSQNFFWYVYATSSAVNPSVVPTFGNPDQLIYFTGTNTLYEKQDNGTTINWSPVLIQNVGEKVLPLQTASLDSPEEIWAAFDTLAGVVGVDTGSG